jgi:hypothetical protein
MSNEHAHDAHTSTIYINTIPQVVTQKTLSFDEIVSLAYNGAPPTGAGVVFTVTFRKGDDAKQQGSLVAGDTVKVKDGMVFNVSATDKS